MIRIFSGQQPQEDYLAHFGINGMKWGVRRYQNPDGTLTEEGKKRYGVGSAENAVDMFVDQQKRYRIGKTAHNLSIGMSMGGVGVAVAGLLTEHANDKLSTILMATGMGSAVGALIPRLIANHEKVTIDEIATKHREHMYDENDSDYQEYKEGVGKFKPFDNAYSGDDPQKVKDSLTKKFKLLAQSWTFGETSDVVPGMWDYKTGDKQRAKALGEEYAKADIKYKTYADKNNRSFNDLRDYYIYTHGFPLRMSFFEKLMDSSPENIPHGISKVEYESKMWDRAWDMVLDTCSDKQSLQKLMNSVGADGQADVFVKYNYY